MNIGINQQSNLAIYEQIVEQIKDEIIKGHLQEKDMLPSIRSLARELHISVITTKRAYEVLEEEGLIYSVAGKGFYVNKQNKDMLREKKVQKIESAMLGIIDACKGAKLTLEDAQEMLQLLWEEKE